jgi:adenylate cyclase
VIRDLDDWLVRRICSFQPKGKAEVLSIFEVLGPRSMAASDDDDLCKMFDAALLSLEAADWSKAENMFEEILSAYPADGPSLFYLERCRRYHTSPPTSGDQTVIRTEFPKQ